MARRFAVAHFAVVSLRLESGLVFERDDRAAVAAQSCDSLEITVGARHGHDGPVAVDRVSGGGEVPAAAFGTPGKLGGRLAQGLVWG